MPTNTRERRPDSETERLAEQVATVKSRLQSVPDERELQAELAALHRRLDEVESAIESLQRRVRTSARRSSLRACDLCGTVCVRYDTGNVARCPACGNNGLQVL
ncbi:hypothetical protein [Halorussus amylolyticus]|uniref:hypothetical protein n=1 Tax=Halorussus amylolyticus TaxID=1126242 RepID=UPI0010511960|nr:hypothetical protein [Halorussus amylolyticus]